MIELIKLVSLFCVCFTMYFLSMVLYETVKDLKHEPRHPRWIFMKKLWRKFVSNLIYRLP